MVEEKSNEIPAVSELPDLPGTTLKGTVVTADALNTQKPRRPSSLKALTMCWLSKIISRSSAGLSAFPRQSRGHCHSHVAQHKKRHGRIEVRSCWQSEDVKWIPAFREWKGMKSICVVQRTSTKLTTGETTTVRRYFISSLPLEPQETARCIREHRDVENSCHWSLDVIFGEDCRLARAGNEAASLRILRSIAMNYLTDAGKRPESADTRMRMMTKAAMSTKYLSSVLGYNPTGV